MDKTLRYYIAISALLPLTAILSIRIGGATIGTWTAILLILIIKKHYNYKWKTNSITKDLLFRIILLSLYILMLCIVFPVQIKQLFFYIQFLLCYFVSGGIFRNNPDTEKIFFKSMLFFAFITLSLGYVQFYFQLSWFPKSFGVVTELTRMFGSMLSPNGFGYCVALICSTLISKLYYDYLTGKRLRKRYIFLFIAAVGALFLSESRSALLGFFLSVLLVIAFDKANWKLRILLFIFFVLLVIGYFFLVESFKNLYSRSLVDPRWILWMNAVTLFINDPNVLIAGLGIGDANRSLIQFSDNLFLELILAGGFPFLLIFASIIMYKLPKKKRFLLKERYLFLYFILRQWRIIFIVASIFSSAIAFLPFSSFFALIFFAINKLAFKLEKLPQIQSSVPLSDHAGIQGKIIWPSTNN